MRQISTNGIDPGIDTPNSRTREKRKANACSCIVTSQGGKPIAQEQHRPRSWPHCVLFSRLSHVKNRENSQAADCFFHAPGRESISAGHSFQGHPANDDTRQPQTLPGVSAIEPSRDSTAARWPPPEQLHPAPCPLEIGTCPGICLAGVATARTRPIFHPQNHFSPPFKDTRPPREFKRYYQTKTGKG